MFSLNCCNLKDLYQQSDNPSNVCCTVKIIYIIKNNNGPRIEPWRTPQWICSKLELKPFVLTYFDRLCRYWENQLLATVLMPSDSIFGQECHHRLYRKFFGDHQIFYQTKFPLSSCSLILSVKWIKAWDVEYFCLKANCKS